MSLPKYEPNKWNQDILIRKSHNCYSYALNKIEPYLISNCRKETKKKYFCQRKNPISSKKKKITYYDCQSLINNILKSNSQIKLISKNDECPKNFYRVALFLLSRKDNHHLTMNDFHFYRQDTNKLWSHKDGWRKATNKDKHGKLISNPEIAEKDNKSKLCAYFLFPNN